MPQRLLPKVLARSPVLRAAPEPAVRALASSGVVRRVAAGQLLCGEAQRTGRVWFVADGLLHATAQSGDGMPVTVDVLRPGDAYGYLHCFCENPPLWQGEDVSGLVDAQVLGIPADRFLQFVEDHQPVARALLGYTAERVCALTLLRAISVEPAERRVRSVLAYLHDRLGPRIPMTRPMIAMVAGLTTETVSRAMAPLSRRKLVALRRGAVEILDRSRL